MAVRGAAARSVSDACALSNEDTRAPWTWTGAGEAEADRLSLAADVDGAGDLGGVAISLICLGVYEFFTCRNENGEASTCALWRG